jgi:hypothetical protein
MIIGRILCRMGFHKPNRKPEYVTDFVQCVRCKRNIWATYTPIVIWWETWN